MANWDFDVLIVGGGMVGSAMAASLAQSGLSIALVEARTPKEFDSRQDYDLRVSAISAASKGFLQQIGAWQFIAAQRLSEYSQMRIWEEEAANDLRFTASDIQQKHLGTIVENTLILDAIWQQLASVTKYCPSRISSMNFHDEYVDVGLADSEYIRARLVIAADGANSNTRALAGIPTFGHSYRQQGIVAVVKTSQGHGDTAWQRFMPSGPLAFLPLNDGRCSIVWSANDELATQLLGLDDNAFCQRLTEASQGRLGEVVATGPRAAFPLQMLQAENYVRPRLALIGDAAHVVHPLAGQGVNLGFGDSECLAGILIEAQKSDRDPGGFKLLRKYERARKAEDALMVQVTDGLSRLYSSEHSLLRLGRREGVRAVNILKPLKAALIRHAVGQ